MNTGMYKFLDVNMNDCVCMYTYMYLFLYNLCTYMSVFIYFSMCVYIYVCLNVICLCTEVCLYAFMYVCKWVSEYIHTFTYVLTHAYIFEFYMHIVHMCAFLWRPNNNFKVYILLELLWSDLDWRDVNINKNNNNNNNFLTDIRNHFENIKKNGSIIFTLKIKQSGGRDGKWIGQKF